MKQWPPIFTHNLTIFLEAFLFSLRIYSVQIISTINSRLCISCESRQSNVHCTEMIDKKRKIKKQQTLFKQQYSALWMTEDGSCISCPRHIFRYAQKCFNKHSPKLSDSISTVNICKLILVVFWCMPLLSAKKFPLFTQYLPHMSQVVNWF